MKSFSLLLTAITLLVASSCNKNEETDFPNVPVAEYVYLSNPSNRNLLIVNGSVTTDGGYRGLIVYRRAMNETSDDFGAYDLACPSHYEQNCSAMEVSDDGLFAVCPCENEKYLLFDGSPAEGANRGLHVYKAQYDGSRVYITNN